MKNKSLCFVNDTKIKLTLGSLSSISESTSTTHALPIYYMTGRRSGERALFTYINGRTQETVIARAELIKRAVEEFVDKHGA